MTDNELRKLRRNELLELLLEQAREMDRLREENEELKRQLEDRRILIEDCGSMAEAAMRLNDVFAAADRAAKQYLENVCVYKERVYRGMGEPLPDDGDEISDQEKQNPDSGKQDTGSENMNPDIDRQDTDAGKSEDE
ncbi:MAG: hypothetical protein LUE14_11690 [Clostridiales bacterium]|nr:hypothetical protein [Clostridiales bacterium]